MQLCIQLEQKCAAIPDVQGREDIKAENFKIQAIVLNVRKSRS